MDTAVALVQSYLHVNGYFTVVEYPVLGRAGAVRRTRSRISTCSRSVFRAHTPE